MDLTAVLLKVRQNPAAGAAAALATLALAIVVRMTTPITLSYASFYPAVILATVAGGWPMGIGVMLLAAASALFFFVPPYWSFAVKATDFLNAAAFCFVCLIIIAFINLLVELLVTTHQRAKSFAALSERLAESEQQQQTFMRELSHRMKNQYSVILAMARATGGKAVSVDEYKETFAERLRGMSRAHDLLTKTGWEPVPLGELIESTLEPFVEEGRLTTSGPDLRLKEQAVVNFAMALHELATNSAKYGAWSGQKGNVHIVWSLQNGSLTFDWRESDGPEVTESVRRGFGRMILEDIVPAALNGTSRLDFLPQGLCWTLTMPDVDFEPGA